MKKRMGIVLSAGLFLAVGLAAMATAQEQVQMPMGPMGMERMVRPERAPAMPMMTCPMMEGGMMGGGGNARMMGRMMQLRGEMMQKMGEVMMKHGKMIEEGGGK